MSTTDYEEALKKIENVRVNKYSSLNLNGLILKEIPQEILELEDLTTLYLGGNQISDINILSRINSLKYLYLGNNKIKYITSLSKLNNLTTLYLENNQLIDITGLSKLKNLVYLELRNNQIKHLTSLIELNNLIYLGVQNNTLSDITLLSNLSGLQSLNVDGNPLKDPPHEVVMQGNSAVLQYLRDIEKQGLAELNEAKLIIVGEPEAGKSSLMAMLRNPKFSLDFTAPSTLGIDVKPWTFSDPRNIEKILTANIWDFGGQQIQYMTHQFFLTPDSVYVLVCANDRKEAVNFRYWFKIIHLLGEIEGSYSPVLVVKNHKTDKFHFNFDLSEYKKMYPELQIEEREVNLNERNKNYEALEETIQKMLSKLPMVNDKRPAKWSVIRDELRKLAQDHDHIDFKTYAKVCYKHDVKEEASQRLLSGYLHTIGSLLHFVDDIVLRDFIILNPQWAVDAVYAVLVDTEIGKNKGRFKQEKLDDIWNSYDMDERSKLLNLMRKDNFEICYKLDDEDNVFVAPQLLDDIRPLYEWDDEENLKFRFQYTFMPDGIITRLIVRLNARISEGLVWKKGVVLETGQIKAEVVEEEQKGLQVIDIKISGLKSKQKYLLHTIREEIKAIHNRWFKNINFEEMIPCNCKVCVESIVPEYFQYATLEKRYLNQTKKTIECHKSEIDVDVLSLLEGVVEREELDKVQKREFKNEVAPVIVHNNITLPQTEVKPKEIPVEIDLFNKKFKKPNLVNFSIFAPKSIKPNDDFVFNVWIYFPKQYKEIQKIIKETFRKAQETIAKKEDINIENGLQLTFKLKLDNFDIENEIDTIIWNGRAENILFLVHVPLDITKKSYLGEVIVSHDGILLTALKFVIKISNKNEGGFSEISQKNINLSNLKVVPWYKEWWFYGLVSGVITFIVVWFWLNSLPIAISSGVAVGYFVYSLNPKRRFMRAALFSLTYLMFSASPPIALKLGWIEKTKDNDSWFFFDSGDPLNVVVSLGIIALIAWFAWLDSREK